MWNHIFFCLLMFFSVARGTVHSFNQHREILPNEEKSGGSFWADQQSLDDSLCPDVEQCYCYDSGIGDVLADCYDPELDFIPQDLPINLTVLEMSQTSVSALPPNSFINYPSLKQLIMYGNSIHDVQPGALAQLAALEKLDLHANNMTSLPNDFLTPCPQLIEINLSENELTILPNIPSLQKLTTLDVSYNALGSLANSQFEKVPNLLKLDLRANQIATVPSNALGGLSALTSLYLNDNEVSTLQTGTWSDLQRVALIDLSSNRITSLAPDQFSGPGDSLIELRLSNNNIRDIDDNAFRNLPELDVLHLDHNELTDVPEALKSLPALDILSLSGNPLQSIKAKAFDGVKELNEVFLSDMPTLVQVDVDAFSENREIQIIILSNNPNLTEFTADHLPDEDHPLLRILDFSNNGFKYIDEDLFKTKSPLGRVDLQGNPFYCDCNLKWMSQAVIDDVIWARHWSQSSSAPRCGSPVHVYDFMISSMLPGDLSCQDVSITSITDSPLVVHLHSPVHIQVILEHGLPASKWLTPDGEEHIPLRSHPLAKADLVSIKASRDSQRPLVTEHYTTGHQVIATLEYSNATSSVAGVHRVTGQNANGERSMDITLEVLPYELTLPPPTVNTASNVRGLWHQTGVIVVLVLVLMERLVK